jgi:fatty-acyl-CoA synthase
MNVDNLTIDALVRNAASAYPHKEAFIDGDVRLTFADFDRHVDAFATALKELGVGKGDKVAALFFNQWEFSLTYFAALRLGALIVPLNNRLVADELAYQINDASVRVLVYASGFAAVAEELSTRTSVAAWVVAGAPADEDEGRTPALGAPPMQPESLEALLEKYAGSRPAIDWSISHTDPSAIWYTSGTTGRPKGAVVSHSSTIWAATSLALATRMNHQSRLLAVAPMFHRGPTDGMHIASFLLGMTQTMLGTFSPEGMLAAIQKHRSTHAFIVPAMTFAVLGVPDRASYDLTSMQCWMTASAPFPEDYRARLEAETTLPAGRIYNAYGITEALLIATLRPEQAADHPGSVGQAVPTCRIRILDAQRNDLEAGSIGEITVSTPAMGCGYASDNAAWDAVTFEQDGRVWYSSGDLGYLDDQAYLHIVDRSKDMVITGGENVYSAEVEQALVGMPGVAEVAVIGTPDERWGEAVTAVIVTADGATIDASDIDAYCAVRLADYKRPRVVRFVDSLPRNSFGKVRKDQLRHNVGGMTR